jgi:hypothetical protein
MRCMCSVPFASLSSFWTGSEKSIASGAQALIAVAFTARLNRPRKKSLHGQESNASEAKVSA